MNDWVKQKPRGFGEGKVYDTSIEDKLFEELKHIRQAQAANLNKLKNNPIEPSSKKVPDAAPSRVRVRLVNLPKKKNIQRDLKSAFQGIPGIIDIIPAVSGNKKTKDPICKGFAFVDFRSEEAAARFVQLYSTQNIAFGKVQKLIKCEILNSKSSSSDCLQASDNHNAAAQLTIPASEANINGTSIVNDPTLDSLEITYDDSDDLVEEPFREESPKVAENLQSDNASKVDVDDGVEPRENSEADSLSSMQLEINSTTESKISAKGKVKNAPQKKLLSKGKVKVPKLGIPGSAKRLKIKEKAVLTDVFSKYGRKAELASKTD
ncbi:RNA binding protein [Quillaja saponaria]|uniref:RNA binding protein n=1 Tax=Quillaja saponaria TaxID=32244 RepID=A0AAD7KPW5_QUISA|nr:RNA binding protein [Quillaja saponaria]